MEQYRNNTISRVDPVTRTIESVVKEIVDTLTRQNETVSVAESFTGGAIMSTITSVSGSSTVFRGGVVSYATDLKNSMLSVDPGIIAFKGVVSKEVAHQMAEGVIAATSSITCNTTWGISTTGVAGPSLQDNNPAGTVFIGISGKNNTIVLGPYLFTGDRHQIRNATIMEVLERFRRYIKYASADNV